MDNLEFVNSMKGLNTPGEFAHQQKPARNRKTKMAKSEWTEEELREEIVKVITSLVKHYILSYIPSLNQLDVELRKQVDYWVNGIMSPVKSATYLEGNGKLPESLTSRIPLLKEMLDELGFKSTKEWKK